MRMETDRSRPRTIDKSGNAYVLDCVRAAIQRCLCRYDIKDVEEALTSMGRQLSRASIYHAMNRLVREREILVAERGRGGRATIYKKPGT